MSSTLRSTDGNHRALVVVVDDSQNHSRMVSKILTREGFRVTVARTAADARAILGSERVHAVVCELTLPDCSAESFLDFVLGLYPAARVVFTCGQFDGRRRQALIARGAIECTSLPLDLDRLKELLLARVPPQRAGDA